MNLPDELKKRNQWALAGPDKAPHAIVDGKLIRIGATNLDALMSFDQCNELLAVHTNMLGMGFVLTKDDPYTVIDLDVKDSQTTNKAGEAHPPSEWCSPADVTRFNKILERFRTYIEVSFSRKGLHIWLRGSVPKGARRGGIEIYSDARFMICTGKAIRTGRYKYDTANDVVVLQKYPGDPHPIVEMPGLLDELYGEVSANPFSEPPESIPKEELDGDETMSDVGLVRMALSADNGEKFTMLCNGQWASLGYPSQSEADAALMSILAFYSPNNEQCKRLFRYSHLGRRDKAHRNDVYLDRTLQMVRRKNYDQKLVMDAASRVQDVVVIDEQDAQFQKTGDFDYDSSLQYPPGFTGEIAEYIFHSSMRPVKEVAITGALGMMAGLCGKAFPVNDESGTNLFLTLVARSAIGKEAMYAGITRIIDACRMDHPLMSQFFSFNDYASGQALIKALGENSCFLHMNSEWGRQLRRMASDHNADGPMQKLRTVMTSLHSKSGPVGVTGGLHYSNDDKNSTSITGAAYSIIGETTPGVYYDSLDTTMMEDGFLSRFIVIEYNGGRVPTNYNRVVKVPGKIVKALGSLCSRSMNLITSARYQHIALSPVVEEMSREFDGFCDDRVNSAGDNESFRQLWNRGHLHSLRVAGLLAVGDNNVTPVIEKHHYEWARSLILHHAGMMLRKFAEGKVGNTDDTRMVKIINVLKKYLKEKPIVNPLLWNNKVVSRRYLHTKIRSNAAFSRHKLGLSNALDGTIRNLCDNGYIEEIPKPKALTEYATSEKIYRIHMNV